MARRHSGLANREETRRNGSCGVMKVVVGYIKGGPDNGMHYFTVVAETARRRRNARERTAGVFLAFSTVFR